MTTLNDKYQSGQTRIWKSNVDLNSRLEITFHLRHEQTDNFLESLLQHPSERKYLATNELGKTFVLDEEGFQRCFSK